MRKLISILISAVIMLSMYGCSRAELEEKPVVIDESSEDAEITITGEAAPTNNSANDKTETLNKTETFAVTEPTPLPYNFGVGDISEETTTSTIIINGKEQTVHYKTYQSVLGYRISYDVDRFTAETNMFGADSFMTSNANVGVMPFIYVEIKRHDLHYVYRSTLVFKEAEKENPDNLEANYISKYMWFSVPITDQSNNYYYMKEWDAGEIDPDSLGTVKAGKYTAYHYTITKGDDWNSEITHYYFIKTDLSVYEISAHYFVEAEKEYDDRIAAMLETLELETFK